MEVYTEKEVCLFVGGTGTKAGVTQGGGCTREWLLSKGCDPSALFGPDGGCVYQAMSLEIDTNCMIAGSVGQFAGVEAGMFAYLYGDTISGFYEVTAVGANYESITFGGCQVYIETEVNVYIGGAYSSLQLALFNSNAMSRNCWIFTNKDEVLAATAELIYAGGNVSRNTWHRAIGYNQSLSCQNGCFISDMDEGGAFYRSAEQIMQEGIGSGCKIILDGSAVGGTAVNFQRDNMELRNIYVIGSAGYDCIQSEGGHSGHSHGLILKGCGFDGGLNGFNGIDGCDNIVFDDCRAGPNISGWGFCMQDSSLEAKSIHLSRCIADGCTNGYRFNIPALLDGCLGRNLAVGVHGDGDTKVAGCVFYNITAAAFELDSDKARLSVWNTIAVMNEAAQYGVFHVMSGGGSIAYENYNCFIDRLGGAAELYDENDWPVLFAPGPAGHHTLRQDPLFVHAAGGDFKLQDTSPCVEAGRPDLCGNALHIGFYVKPDAPGSGGINPQYRNNRQYGVGRNTQYG